MQNKIYFNELSNQPLVSQLQQLTSLTWDGDLIGKIERNTLVERGLAQKMNNGWNIITPMGVEYLQGLGFINP